MDYLSFIYILFAIATIVQASFLIGLNHLAQWHRNKPRQISMDGVSINDRHGYYAGSITDSTNVCDGVRKAVDNYTMYTGDGYGGSGWPTYDEWISFDIMFEANKKKMRESCSAIVPTVAPTTNDEINAIWYSIQTVAKKSGVDHRLILAIILEETNGCVRAPSTMFRDHRGQAYRKVGLMGSPEGIASCNSAFTTPSGIDETPAPRNLTRPNHRNNTTPPVPTVLTPCPDQVIHTMIHEAVNGASSQVLTAAMNGNSEGYSAGLIGREWEARRSYYGARTYLNGWTVDVELSRPNTAGECYVSNIANRLTGWVDAESKCPPDGR